MPGLKPIGKPRQLFVEGRDAEEFFMALLRNMRLVDEVQIQNFGGINDLPGFLPKALAWASLIPIKIS